MDDLKLSKQQLQTLRHMLGIDRPELRISQPTRNYYCASPGDAEMAELERLGAVEKYSTSGGDDWFRCTASGRLAGVRSHREIRFGPAQRRYLKFLDCREVCEGLTFRDFLTHPAWAETRQACR